MKFKDTDVSVHLPVDTSDPGFAIKGFKLRWVSGGVEARRAGRMWQPLKLSMLPEKIIKSMSSHNAAWLSASAADTIRRRDLVLAFAPIDQVEARRRMVRENQAANESVFRSGQHVGNGVKTDSDTSARNEKVASAANEFG
jgi:hypothetical protein